MQTSLEDFNQNIETITEEIDPLKYTPDYQVSGNKEYRHMDIKDIAKLIRKDYKEAFPDMKISVTISRYSMGQSINATVKRIPSKYLLSWDEIAEHIICSNNYDASALGYLMKKYDEGICHIAFVKDAVYEALQEIHGRYRYSERESMTDYYYSSYYGDCDVNGAEIVF